MLNKVIFSAIDVKIHDVFLNANFTNNLGLLGGKIANVIYLLDLAKSDPDTYGYCADFAFELLEEIDANINSHTLIHFKYGLCGIGWGVEFLVKNQYIGLEEDFCLKFESRIQASLLYGRYSGISIGNGLIGYLLYFISRIESSLVIPQSEIMYMNKKCIINIIDKVYDYCICDDDIRVFTKEVENTNYGEVVPLVMSKWEYPVLLWCLIRLLPHEILLQKVENCLERVLFLFLDSNEIPRFKNNQILLLKVINTLPKEYHTKELIRKYIHELKVKLTMVSNYDIDITFDKKEYYKNVL